jgi:hypothetical protein
MQKGLFLLKALGQYKAIIGQYKTMLRHDSLKGRDESLLWIGVL